MLNQDINYIHTKIITLISKKSFAVQNNLKHQENRSYQV